MQYRFLFFVESVFFISKVLSLQHTPPLLLLLFLSQHNNGRKIWKMMILSLVRRKEERAYTIALGFHCINSDIIQTCVSVFACGCMCVSFPSFLVSSLRWPRVARIEGTPFRGTPFSGASPFTYNDFNMFCRFSSIFLFSCFTHQSLVSVFLFLLFTFSNTQRIKSLS